jgi:PII-like signaling protein
MELPEDAILLRIFIGESDRHRNRPLYEINGFLPVLDEMMNGGLVTLESAKVIHYGPEKKRRDHT